MDPLTSGGMERYDDPANSRAVEVYRGGGLPATARLVFLDQGSGEAAESDSSNDLMKYWRQLLAHKWKVVALALLGFSVRKLMANRRWNRTLICWS